MKDIEELKNRKEKAKLGGGEKYLYRQRERGFLTARDRIDKLVDPDTFLELGLLAHSEQEAEKERTPTDGIITGLARVGGRPVAVQAIDKSVFAGTTGKIHARKSEEIHAFALKHKLPLFSLVEGAGLRIPDGMGSDGISEMLFPESLLSHNREVPMITAVLGDCYGDPGWIAVASDFLTQHKKTSMVVAGSRMLEIATGEKITDEEIGGWEVHAKKTGLTDNFADEEIECIEQMKEFFEYMPLNSTQFPDTVPSKDDPYRQLDKIVDIIPTRRSRAYDMRKVIKEIVDNGDYLELKPLYGTAILTVLTRINGRVVGVLANQPMSYGGAPGWEESDKATNFICLCDSFNIPMVFLHDTPGFRVSKEAEKRKILNKILIWNQALKQSTVPKISIIVRKSIGAAYANMCGPTMGADIIVAWPGAEINFTGPEVGVNVVYNQEIENSNNPDQKRKNILETWGFDSTPYKAAGKYLIDDIIDPRDTRKFLAKTLGYIQDFKEMKSKRHLANWPTRL